MKSKKLVLAAIIAFMASCGGSSEDEKPALLTGKSHVVKKQVMEFADDLDLDMYKKGDVEVLQLQVDSAQNTLFNYQVNYFHDFSGSLQVYTAFIGDTTIYDRVSYTWVNDSTVSVDFFNQEAKRNVVFFGNGAVSGIEIDS